VRAGERDIFFVDDTHWASPASQRIAQALHKLLDTSNQIKTGN
jgi:hypothetical protein